MSWSSSTTTEDVRSFDTHVQGKLAEWEQNITAFLQPILEELGPLHEEGRRHGAISPAALRYNIEGELDRVHFRLQRRDPGVRPGPFAAHAYLAPECLTGSTETSSTDCYALGAVLFQIIAGHPPAPAARRKEKDDSLCEDAYPQWPATLLNAVNRCLALDPTQRVANVQELWQSLPSAPTPPAVCQPAPPPVEASGFVVIPATPADANPDDESAAVDADTTPAISASLPPDEATPTSISAVPSFPTKIHLRERLANASVGKPYRQCVRDVFGDQADRIGEIALAVPDESGLIFDQVESILHGTPKAPGELNLALTYHLVGTASGLAQKQDLALTINPDPKSLWKNVASDPVGPFAKPDDDMAFLATPHLTVLAASVRGRSHAHAGSYRDDDFALHFAEATGWHVFAAADGAGSAKLSRRGSQIACQKMQAELAAKLGAANELDDALAKLGASSEAGDVEKLRGIAYNLLVTTAHQALLAIGAEAAEQQAALRDFSTTLIVVLVKKLVAKWFIASFAIGDGGAGVSLNSEQVKLLSQPDSGEFAGQTLFLTTPQVFNDREALQARAHAVLCDKFTFLAVMTDGVSDPIFPSDAQFASAATWEEWRQQLFAAANLTRPLPGMEQALQEYLQFPSPGHHDDRTLILALPTQS